MADLCNAEYQRQRYREKRLQRDLEIAEGKRPPGRAQVSRWTDEALTEPWLVFRARQRAKRQAARDRQRAEVGLAHG